MLDLVLLLGAEGADAERMLPAMMANGEKAAAISPVQPALEKFNQMSAT